MAAVAGLGVAWLGNGLATGLAPRIRWPAPQADARKTIKAAFLALVLIPGVWAVARTHPFQIAYWNVFAGGYAGARADDLPQANDYWGMSYRLGFRWLNDNAPDGTLLRRAGGRARGAPGGPGAPAPGHPAAAGHHPVLASHRPRPPRAHPPRRPAIGRST